MIGALTWIVFGIVALWGLDRLFLWFEEMDWIYWRKKKPKHRGGAMRAFIPPLVQQAQDAKDLEEERDSGDGDDTKNKRPDVNDPRYPPMNIPGVSRKE